MREIEFRAKDIETGEWVYGYLREIFAGVNEKRRFVICPALNFAYNGFTDFDETEIIPETIGQHTGLKDRNGVKIFEGDIVKTHDQIGVVIYRLGQFIIDFGDNWLGVHSFYDNEAIGNIHDNPELLEELK